MKDVHVAFAGVIAGTIVLLSLIAGVTLGAINADTLTTQQRIACLTAGGEYGENETCVIRK